MSWGDVVAVAAGQRDRQRDAAAVADQVVLEPVLPRSTGLGPVAAPPLPSLWPRKGAPAILENPRYTGYAIFGRWTKHETLLDPDDVAAGHVVRFRRSSPDRVVRSRRPAHPEIVSVDTFTQAQLMRRSRAAGGMRGRGKLDRRTFTTSRPYRLRGRFRCTVCERKMLAATIRDTIYYRCLARTIAPGSPVLADHPRTVNVREDHVIDPLNDWIMQVYDRDHIDQTVAAIVAANPPLTSAHSQRTRAAAKLKDAEKRLRRHQAAIEAGVNPTALVELINAADAERAGRERRWTTCPNRAR